MKTFSFTILFIMIWISFLSTKEIKEGNRTEIKKSKVTRTGQNPLPVNSFITNNLEFFLNYTMFTDEKFNTMDQSINKTNTSRGGIRHEKK